MKAKLIIEGKEFDIDILDPELEKLVKPKKKTGYERIDGQCMYWAVLPDGDSYAQFETNSYWDDEMYECANYYSDKTVADNNARADRLMRQLRRFAVEHREKDISWCDYSYKYYIFYDHNSNTFDTIDNQAHETYGTIYFESAKSAVAAIETFRDELIWYFTEYKDSL